MSRFWKTASAVPRYQSVRDLLLRRQQLDELAEPAVEETPAALDVTDQGVRLVLREDPIRRMPELTQLDSAKSMMRNLPPNGTAGFARQSVRPEPRAAAAGEDHRDRALGKLGDAAAGLFRRDQHPARASNCPCASMGNVDSIAGVDPMNRPCPQPHEGDRAMRPVAPDPGSRSLAGAPHDPFAVLGCHRGADGWTSARAPAVATV